MPERRFRVVLIAEIFVLDSEICLKDITNYMFHVIFTYLSCKIYVVFLDRKNNVELLDAVRVEECKRYTSQQ